MSGPQAHWLPDGRRLHLHHGPIDLIVEAWGEEAEIRAAYAQAVARFQTVLDQLVAELPELRRPAGPTSPWLSNIPPPLTPPHKGEGDSGTLTTPSPLWGGVRGGGIGSEDLRIPLAGPTARRMHAAVSPFAAETFITPMAAVAGSVADDVLAAMLVGRRLDRAYVNNGGDIALHLAEGTDVALAIGGVPALRQNQTTPGKQDAGAARSGRSAEQPRGLDDKHALPPASANSPQITIRAADPVRGVATSGWRGRSFSLGIADGVTVLARTGAAADAAATVIANAVDLPGHAAIRRRPARELQPDSDLGGTPVTVGVGALSRAEIGEALDRGLAVAADLRRRGLIAAAALFLAGEARVCGPGIDVGHTLSRLSGEKTPLSVSPCGLATSPPLRGGEERRQAGHDPSLEASMHPGPKVAYPYERPSVRADLRTWRPSSPPSGGEVARPQPETERGQYGRSHASPGTNHA